MAAPGRDPGGSGGPGGWSTRTKGLVAAGGAVVIFAVGWVVGSATKSDSHSEALAAPASTSPSGSGAPTSSMQPDSLSTATPDPGASVSPVNVPNGVVPAAPVPTFTCPAATVTVEDAEGLSKALKDAGPGTVIHLKDGTYQGNFTAATAGTADDPIYLCGGTGAVLQSDGPKGGYVLHFQNAAYWRADGFTVTNGQKGVMLDQSNHVGLQNLTVYAIGDEAVHLRNFSSYNVVRGLDISDTGHRKPKFGEGVYVGTAQSNWAEFSGGKIDNSDHNFVLDNRIHGTKAESIDIKEGTSNGVVAGNTFDGSALSGADSWVDVKGNDWLIAGNHGINSPKDGFQTHVILDGWGQGNVFTDNVADLNGGRGVGYYLHKQLKNRVLCNNKESGARKGLSNFPCSN